VLQARLLTTHVVLRLTRRVYATTSPDVSCGSWKVTASSKKNLRCHIAYVVNISLHPDLDHTWFIAIKDEQWWDDISASPDAQSALSGRFRPIPTVCPSLWLV
jgi:hypothetical protein